MLNLRVVQGLLTKTMRQIYTIIYNKIFKKKGECLCASTRQLTYYIL